MREPLTILGDRGSFSLCGILHQLVFVRPLQRSSDGRSRATRSDVVRGERRSVPTGDGLSVSPLARADAQPHTPTVSRRRSWTR